MKILLFSFCIVAIFISHSYAQSITEIKADREKYIWGEAKGITLKKADQDALSMLSSQISTHVESSFSILKQEMQTNGQSDSFKSTCNSIVKTYSQATLNNTDRIVISNEPSAHVFRYIKRCEIKKVFEQRAQKIIQFVKSAENAEAEYKIADALRYYYWAILLLKSHPEGNTLFYNSNEFGSKQLISWLPEKINNTFSNLRLSVDKIDNDENVKLIHVRITYKEKPITNFDYTYWDGRDWSNLISAKDGIGFIELYGLSQDIKDVKLKAEYIFEGEARVDKELETVMGKIDPIPFRKSYYDLPIIIKDKQKFKQSPPVLTQVPDEAKIKYKKSLNLVFESLKTKNYQNAKSCFTSNGYKIFNKLLAYGKANILDTAEVQFMKYDNEVIARSTLMSFDFKANQKKFVEGVCFDFNKEGKISNITFSLSDRAVNSLLGKTFWNEMDRLTLIRFLENYKTAYALKRLSYIENIFADDALIITGREVSKVQNNEVGFSNNKVIKFNSQTKQQYIKNLKYSFSSKEFINLKFEESKIRKSGKGGNIYGIQIKQNYFSSNYGDVGYLFLMVDLNKPDEPLIHVRTWQPQASLSPIDTIYDLSCF